MHQLRSCGAPATWAAHPCGGAAPPALQVTRQITKHNFLVMDVKDIPRIIKEAFYLARTGRPGALPVAARFAVAGPQGLCGWAGVLAQPPGLPGAGRHAECGALGVPCVPRNPAPLLTHDSSLAPAPIPPAGPVLVDVPKDVQQTLDVPDWDSPMTISAYMSRLPPPPQEAQLQQVLDAIRGSKRPALYVGGGCVDSGEALAQGEGWGPRAARRTESDGLRGGGLGKGGTAQQGTTAPG